MKRRNFFALFLGAIGAFFGLRAKPTLIERWDSGEIFYVTDIELGSSIYTSPSYSEESREIITSEEARTLLDRTYKAQIRCNGKLIGASNPNHPYVKAMKINEELALAA